MSLSPATHVILGIGVCGLILIGLAGLHQSDRSAASSVPVPAITAAPPVPAPSAVVAPAVVAPTQQPIQPTETQPILTPHEQRLADLRQQRDSLASQHSSIQFKLKMLVDGLGPQVLTYPEMQGEVQKLRTLHSQIDQIDEAIAAETQRGETESSANVPESSKGASSAPMPNNSTELQMSRCVDDLTKRYTSQLAEATCQCIMAVYQKTGSAERAQNAADQCSTIAFQALTNPGQTATLPWDAIK